MKIDMTLRRQGDHFVGEFFCANVFVWPRYPAGWATIVQTVGGERRFDSTSLTDALRAGRLAVEDATLEYHRKFGR